MSRNPKANPNKLRKADKVTMLLPPAVKRELKKESAEQDCSMSWIVTEVLMERYSMTQEEIESLEGPRPTKTFTERREKARRGEPWSEGKRRSMKRQGKNDDYDDDIDQDFDWVWLKCPNCEKTVGVTQNKWKDLVKQGVHQCRDCGEERSPEEFLSEGGEE